MSRIHPDHICVRHSSVTDSEFAPPPSTLLGQSVRAPSKAMWTIPKARVRKGVGATDRPTHLPLGCLPAFLLSPVVARAPNDAPIMAGSKCDRRVNFCNNNRSVIGGCHDHSDSR